VNRRRRHPTATRIGATIAIFLLVAATVAAAVVAFSALDDGDVEIRLGDERFDAGPAEVMAREIAESGPILYSDVSGGERDILLGHDGADPGSGWVAFAARGPGSERDCYLEWMPDTEILVDTCTGERYPPDGSGLTQYPVEVVDGNVIVDLNADQRPPAASTTTTGSTVIETGG
jgi:hypothetical protein